MKIILARTLRSAIRRDTVYRSFAAAPTGCANARTRKRARNRNFRLARAFARSCLADARMSAAGGVDAPCARARAPIFVTQHDDGGAQTGRRVEEQDRLTVYEPSIARAA